jgi:hypothetical protein
MTEAPFLLPHYIVKFFLNSSLQASFWFIGLLNYCCSVLLGTNFYIWSFLLLTNRKLLRNEMLMLMLCCAVLQPAGQLGRARHGHVHAKINDAD